MLVIMLWFIRSVILQLFMIITMPCSVPSRGVNGSGNDATSPAGNVNPCIRVELKKDVVPETDYGVQAEVADTGSNNG